VHMKLDLWMHEVNSWVVFCEIEDVVIVVRNSDHSHTCRIKQYCPTKLLWFQSDRIYCFDPS
jgi:hypothetical protein